MDWVGWYTLFWWVAVFGHNCYKDGQPALDYSIKNYLMGSILLLPAYGRLFGWW